MNSATFLLVAILCIILIAAPRRYFLFPFIMAACFVPMDQKLFIFDLDFTALRMLILLGGLRLIMRREIRAIHWNNFDKLILSWVIVGSLIYSMLHANTSAVIYKAGVIYDGLGMYWLFRQAVRDWEDVFHAISIFAFFAIISAPLIALEKFQDPSFFTIFGDAGGKFHRGRFRAAGPFPHYIMMGCFWASLLPLIYARIKTEKNKTFFGMAIIASLSNVYFSASSTPIITLLAMIFFWKLYDNRMHGKFIFWSTCFGLFSLHLIMNAPVWHLMARVDVFAGSTGWHRYYLFDNFIRNTAEWFVFGTKRTGHWGLGLSDITNQFVLEGVRGGIVTLTIFLIIIYSAIKIPGKLSLGNVTTEVKWIGWGVCVAMLGHFVTFWGVSYFGQINMLLYFTFALVGFILEKSTEDSVRAAKSSKSPSGILGTKRRRVKLRPQVASIKSLKVRKSSGEGPVAPFSR